MIPHVFFLHGDGPKSYFVWIYEQIEQMLKQMLPNQIEEVVAINE